MLDSMDGLIALLLVKLINVDIPLGFRITSFIELNGKVTKRALLTYMTSVTKKGKRNLGTEPYLILIIFLSMIKKDSMIRQTLAHGIKVKYWRIRTKKWLSTRVLPPIPPFLVIIDALYVASNGGNGGLG